MGQIQDLLPVEGQSVTIKYWSPVHRPLNWLGPQTTSKTVPRTRAQFWPPK